MDNGAVILDWKLRPTLADMDGREIMRNVDRDSGVIEDDLNKPLKFLELPPTLQLVRRGVLKLQQLLLDARPAIEEGASCTAPTSLTPTISRTVGTGNLAAAIRASTSESGERWSPPKCQKKRFAAPLHTSERASKSD